MISIRVTWDGGGIIYLLPPSVSYFEDKETALKKQEEQQMASIHIGSINNSGNFVLGDAVNSTFSIDNSVHRIENEIEEKGGEDKAELSASSNRMLAVPHRIHSLVQQIMSVTKAAGP